MISLSEELVQISEAGAAAVLATVVEVEAGVHVEPGAKCLVRDEKVSGETIGDRGDGVPDLFSDSADAVARLSDCRDPAASRWQAQPDRAGAESR